MKPAKPPMEPLTVDCQAIIVGSGSINNLPISLPFPSPALGSFSFLSVCSFFFKLFQLQRATSLVKYVLNITHNDDPAGG